MNSLWNTRGGDDNGFAEYLSDLIERMKMDYERSRYTDYGRSARNTDENKFIEVESVDFDVIKNAEDHRTDDFDIVKNAKVPVLRRGQPFNVIIQFKRKFDIKKDDTWLQFTYGPKPHHTSIGTLVELQMRDKAASVRERNQWGIKIISNEGSKLTLQVQLPTNIAVGVWNMKLRNGFPDSEEYGTFECKNNIYILFNPWVRDDTVFMEQEDARKEYVLSDIGRIFTSNYRNPEGITWVYGQFNNAVLPVCMYILERSGLGFLAKADPIKVVRAVSALINHQDDDGILVGNWTGKYSGGTSPKKWTGSAQILEEYLKSGWKSVKYGQCWVFGGLCTTVCRALGIPTRTITNFFSAHDANDNLTIDYYYDKNFKEIKRENADSIWNFHVWNDVWMKRPDLPPGYGGWQAIDGTPQERSEGVYQLGPTSLEAVRKGDFKFPYDVNFVFSEVNAKVVHHQGNKILKVEKSRVGRRVVTKKMGSEFNSDEPEDITAQYKAKTGIETDNDGVSYGRSANRIDERVAVGKESDVSVHLRDIERVMIGQSFFVVVDIENQSNEARTVSFLILVNSVFYNGVSARKIKRDAAAFTLAPGQMEELVTEVTAEEYLDKLEDFDLIKVHAITTVEETEQTLFSGDIFSLDKPRLQLEIQEEDALILGKEYELIITMINPLRRYLEDSSFTVEGHGLTYAFTDEIGDIPPLETVTHIVKFRPQRIGLRNIVVAFNSRQISDVTASKSVYVELDPHF